MLTSSERVSLPSTALYDSRTERTWRPRNPMISLRPASMPDLLHAHYCQTSVPATYRFEPRFSCHAEQRCVAEKHVSQQTRHQHGQDTLPVP
mgnify:CR=1 FL=1